MVSLVCVLAGDTGFCFHTARNCVIVSLSRVPLYPYPLSHFQTAFSCLQSLQAESCLTTDNKPATIFMVVSKNRYRVWCVARLA